MKTNTRENCLSQSLLCSATSGLALILGLGILPALAAPPYMEVDGRVVIEAEHFATNTPAANGDRWAISPDEDIFPTANLYCLHPNAHGGKFISVQPDNNNNGLTGGTGTATGWDARPWVDYVVRISTPGTYRLWLRWRGWDGSSDSMYAQILGLADGAGGAINDWYNYFGNSGSGFNGQWRGSAVPEVVNAAGTAVNASWEITTPGDYTIRLTFREDGCAVDKLCLQLESLANPTDAGPPESPILQDVPFIWTQSPLPNAVNVSPLTAFQVQIRDGNQVALSSTDPTFLLNGVPLSYTKSKVGALTTLAAPSPGMLASGSTNTLTLIYQDTGAVNYTNIWQFVASTPVNIPLGFRIDAGSVSSEPGFTVNLHQVLRYDTNGVVITTDLPSTSDRAEGQLRSFLIDANTGVPYTNNLLNTAELLSTIWGDGLDDTTVIPETYINWGLTPILAGGAADVGNFINNPAAPDGYGQPDSPIPGYGTRFDTARANNIAVEFITYVEFPAGLTRLGVNSDDGFLVTCGLNPRERYDTNKVVVLGVFEGGRGVADSLFDVNVAQAGIYPIRLLWYQGGGGAGVEFFHVKTDGTKIPINDITNTWKTGNSETLKAYRSATIPRSAVVDWLSPAPNALNVATGSVVQVQLGDSPDATVNQASIHLYLNGLEVTPDKTNLAPRTTLYYLPTPALAEGSTNTARVEFTDSLANAITQNWTFVMATTAVATVQGELTRKLWNNILPSAGTITALTTWPDFTNNVNYNDLGEATIVNSFEQLQFANPTKDNYGEQFLGYIKPLVSDWYTFYLSSDDHAELWLSTNSSPIGRRLIGFMRTSNSSREYTLGRYVYQRRSIPIYLEAGQRYFVEGLHKEGTGGDHFSVAWWKTNDAPIVTGSAPISGPVLEKFVGAVFTAHPQSRTTSKGQTVTLRAAAYIGVGNVTYQWLKGGNPVSGANSVTHVLSPADVPDSGVYKLRITVDGLDYDSNEATVLIIDDSVPPTVVGPGIGLNDVDLANAGGPGYTVAIRLSEEINGNSAQAATITLSDAGNSVTERNVGGTSNSVLLLKVATALQANFTVTLSGITDPAGNNLPANTVVNCSLAGFTPMVLGTPGVDPVDVAGTVAYALGTNSFLITANGIDIWGNADGGHLVHTVWTGNFDAKVRVESLTQANVWSKAGIMARESLAPGSRNVMVAATPQPLNDLYTFQWRDTTDGTSASLADALRPRGVSYPNAWVRLIRQGNTFTSMIMTNGNDWMLLGTYTPPANYPDQIYVGLATTSHDNIVGDLTTAVYRSFEIGLPADITPPHIESTGIGSDRNIVLNFSAPQSQNYTVWASTNIALPLNQWTIVAQGNVSQSPMSITDLNSTNYPARFYLITIP